MRAERPQPWQPQLGHGATGTEQPGVVWSDLVCICHPLSWGDVGIHARASLRSPEAALWLRRQSLLRMIVADRYVLL